MAQNSRHLNKVLGAESKPPIVLFGLDVEKIPDFCMI